MRFCLAPRLLRVGGVCLPSGLPFLVERNVLVILQPRCIMRTPNMHTGSGSRIFVQSCYANNDMRLRNALGYEVRTTNGTEMPELARRRLKRRQFFFAFHPSEMLPHNTCIRRKRGSMGFAASTAMTVANWHIQLIDFVLNDSTQATALHIFTLYKCRKVY
jgi:hypothetical protein